jgi:hypothetical protein
MEINPAIPKILTQYNINVDEGILVLLGIYLGLDVDKILPEEAVKAINVTHIVDRDYVLKTVSWNVNLIAGEGEELKDWNWVIDWIVPFEQVNKDRAGSWRDAIKRMQKFFAMYPQFRKKDVFLARDLYIRRLKDPRFIMHSHKFIFDGVGAMQKSTLLQYCEEVTRGKGGDTELDIRGRVIN